VVSIAPGASVRQALRLMSLHDISQLPVMDGQNCIGSMSEGAVSAKALENPKILDTMVSEIMDPPFPVVEANQPVEGCIKLLAKGNPALLIRSNGGIGGIITRSDVLEFMMAR
ncbi:MAG TPA: CBS domain-containing protein, partial [Gemmatimonadaceae bacterium]|nr:CBS domain-containing protein [Gemmatimonadaceae bacterium]